MVYPLEPNPEEGPPSIVQSEQHQRNSREEGAAPTAGRITVVRIVDLGETRFLNDAGDELYPPHTDDNSQTVFEDLSAVHGALGPGDHPEYQALAHLRDHLFGIYGLDRAMPDEVFLTHYNTDRRLRYIRIGNIAVLHRDATPEEIGAQRVQEGQAREAAKLAKEQQRAANRAAEAEIKEKRLESLDHGKTPLADFDHAIVTVGDRRFHIPTDRASTILAVRVLQTLAQVPHGVRHVDGDDVTQATWTLMTRAEREMVSKKWTT